MMNKYYRNKKKYLDLLQIYEIQEGFLNLFKKCNSQSSILNSLINQTQNYDLELKLLCLLDFVKINIPTRIKQCMHLECYELTSLLYYQQNKKENEKYFICTYQDCNQQIDISTLDIFFQGIEIDLKFFKLIKQSNPIIIKFTFNQNTKNFVQYEQMPLFEIYTQYISGFNQETNINDKQQFEQQCLQLFQSITQNNLLLENKNLRNKLSQNQSNSLELNLIDQYTQLPIDFPTRCIKCPEYKCLDLKTFIIDFLYQNEFIFCNDFSICIDMRSYIADFTYQKQMFPNQTYTCPLCHIPQQSTMLSSSILDYIYLDSNMLQYIYLSIRIQRRIIFTLRIYGQIKIRRKDYITNLNQPAQYTKLFCILNPTLRIKEPLLLSNCPYQNIVDFQSFMINQSKLIKINFDIETEGLILCKCQSCRKNPIKTITDYIHFHEPFYEALNKFNKLDHFTQLQKFSYIFKQTEEQSFVEQSNSSDLYFEQILITSENLYLINKYTKATQYAKNTPIQIQEFNTYQHIVQLFEEFILQDKVYFLDFYETNQFMIIFGKLLFEENTLDDFDELNKHIQIRFQQKTQRINFCQQRNFFPFEDNPLLFYLIEKDPIQKQIVLYYDEDPKEIQIELNLFLNIFQQIFQCEDFQIFRAILNSKSNQKLDSFKPNCKYFKYMLTVFIMIYEQQTLQEYIMINDETSARAFWTLHQANEFSIQLQINKQYVKTTFVEMLEQAQNKSTTVTIAIIEEPYSYQGILNLSQQISDIQYYFRSNKIIKHSFISIVLTIQQQQRLNFYVHLQKSSQLHFLKIYTLSNYEELNQQILKVILNDDGIFIQQVYIDVSRHNMFQEYSEITLGAFYHLVIKKNLKSEEAMTNLIYSLIPYSLIFTQLE